MTNVGVSDECAELRELNRHTFLAEERRDIGEKGWREFLEQSLAEDFVIRRARADLPDQTDSRCLAGSSRPQLSNARSEMTRP